MDIASIFDWFAQVRRAAEHTDDPREREISARAAPTTGGDGGDPKAPAAPSPQLQGSSGQACQCAVAGA